MNTAPDTRGQPQAPPSPDAAEGPGGGAPTLTPAPRLTTDRLILRGPDRDDLAPFTAWVTRSDRMASVGGTASADDAWRSFLVGIGHWHWHGYGFFTLVEKSGGDIAGRVGILDHAAWQDRELAWHLFDGFEGRGLATEAAAAIRDWFVTTHAPARLVSYIDPANARSQAVARRLGATTDGSRAGHDADCEIWTHPIGAAA